MLHKLIPMKQRKVSHHWPVLASVRQYFQLITTFAIKQCEHENTDKYLHQQKPTGMYVTFVVPDVDVVYKKAVTMGLPIIQEPCNEFYGQRRFLTQDPNGCLIDICSPWDAE